MASYAHYIGTIAAAGLLLGAVATVTARADHQPVIVVPGKPGVPVIVDGIDVSGAAVYGDGGLYRAGHGRRIIDGGGPAYGPYWPGGYYPATGRTPAYGRREIELPHRHLPPPAQDYQRSWHVGPGAGPTTEYPPFDPPPVILAPRPK